MGGVNMDLIDEEQIRRRILEALRKSLQNGERIGSCDTLTNEDKALLADAHCETSTDELYGKLLQYFVRTEKGD